VENTEQQRDSGTGCVVAEVRISHSLGLHARPAAQIARLVSGFQAKVSMTKLSDGLSADCSSVLSMLVLAAGNGTKLSIAGEGPDAAAAVECLVRFFQDGFDED